MALTIQQEKFVHNIIKGMSQREAYKDAYPNAKGSDATIDARACRTFNSDKVQARYQELVEEIKEEMVMSVTEKRMILKRIAHTGDHSDAIRAIDVDNKMCGEYVTKVEGNVQIAKKLEELL